MEGDTNQSKSVYQKLGLKKAFSRGDKIKYLKPIILWCLKPKPKEFKILIFTMTGAALIRAGSSHYCQKQIALKAPRLLVGCQDKILYRAETMKAH